MSKKILGFDIGGHAVHIALRDGKRITRVIVEPLPEGSVRADGSIISFEALGDFIKQTCKKHKICADEAAVILPSSLCFCRRLSMPAMTHKQLTVNLPYEFRDFITSDKDAYYYDYAVLRVLRDVNEVPAEIDMITAAALKEIISEYKGMFRRAGMKLCIAVPIEMAYTNLLMNMRHESHCHCIIDIGHSSVRLFIFNGVRFESSHHVESGCSALDSVIADVMHVDPLLASSYREANHDNCQSLPECMGIYQKLAVEIQRAIHFFRYDNPDIELEHIHLTGGGSKIQPLRDTLEEALTIPILDASEIFDADGVDMDFGLGAAGAAFQ